MLDASHSHRLGEIKKKPLNLFLAVEGRFAKMRKKITIPVNKWPVAISTLAAAAGGGGVGGVSDAAVDGAK